MPSSKNSSSSFSHNNKNKTTASSSSHHPSTNTTTGIKIGRFGRRTWDREYYKNKMALGKRKRGLDDVEEMMQQQQQQENPNASGESTIGNATHQPPPSKRARSSSSSGGGALKINSALETRSSSISSSIQIGRRKLEKINEADDDTHTDTIFSSSLQHDSVSMNHPKRRPFKPKSQFYCALCRVEFRDNHALVDHYNSEQHVHASGMMMRAKKASVEDVVGKLKAAKEMAKKGSSSNKASSYNSKSKAVLSQVSSSLKSQKEQLQERIRLKQQQLKEKELSRQEKAKRKGSIKNVSVSRGKQEKQLEKLLGFQSFGGK